MYNRKEIESIVSQDVTDSGVRHISDMLEEIQNRMFSCIEDKLYYTFDKYSNRIGKPNSKFVELCAAECWDHALLVADSMTKEILGETELFQEFVKSVKQLPDYVSTVREMKLKDIF